MPGEWTISRADGSQTRTGLGIAEVRALIQSGKYGPHDRVQRGHTEPVAIVSVPVLATWLSTGAAQTILPSLPTAPPATRIQPLVAPPTAPATTSGMVPEFEVFSPVRGVRTQPDADDEELDISSLIDIVFQLLIFFMVASVVASPARVTLARSQSGQGLQPVGVLLVGVRASGTLRDDGSGPAAPFFVGTGDVDADPTNVARDQKIEDVPDLPALRNRLVQVRDLHPERSVVVLRCDESAECGVIDDVKRAIQDHIRDNTVYYQIKHVPS